MSRATTATATFRDMPGARGRWELSEALVIRSGTGFEVGSVLYYTNRYVEDTPTIVVDEVNEDGRITAAHIDEHGEFTRRPPNNTLWRTADGQPASVQLKCAWTRIPE